MKIIKKKHFNYYANERQTFSLAECGLTLAIPADIITPADCIYKVMAQGLWGGSMFEFPKGSKLISAVCDISVFISSELNKPVDVYLEHCAHIINDKQSQYLTFVVAKSGPPFKFEYLPGGSFSSLSQLGSISLKHFSVLAIVLTDHIINDSVSSSVCYPASGGVVGIGAGTAGFMVGGVSTGLVGMFVAGAIGGAIGAAVGLKLEQEQSKVKLIVLHNLRLNLEINLPDCMYRGHVFYVKLSSEEWKINVVVSQALKYSKVRIKLLFFIKYLAHCRVF